MVERVRASIVALTVAAVGVIAVPAAAVAVTGSAKDPVPATKAAGPASPGQHPTNKVCAKPSRAREMSCLSMVRTDVTATKGVQRAAAPIGFGPADLRSAYNLPATGSTETVAIVDAYDNPNAEADLAVYRQQYGLPPCTTANGCFKKIDQRGGTSYPSPDAGWAAEIALDLDMVSATCPTCKILLVEADDAYLDNLGAAVNQAVAQGAKYVSNSYGGREGTDVAQADEAYFNHPGVAITVSTGDFGYGVSYPSTSQHVTAVGGTSLVRDTATSRGWTEGAWSLAGSGCSAYVTKPSFQKETGCGRRAVADVSAVADPNTGVAVYHGGWQVFGGTSASAPIIAAVYALAGVPGTGTAPNSYPYAQPGGLNDVTSGRNGSCWPNSYLCTAGPGYDGPTGLGTPNGLAAFRSGPYGTVTGTVTDGTAPLATAKITVGDVTTVTDGQGRYTLTAPPGTYDVSASKFGYATKTVSGITIAEGQTVSEDFALTAKPHVNVTGVVHDGSGHGWPLYATVRVKDEPTAVAYTDPKTGRYALSVPAGNTHTLQVDPLYPGYQRDSQDVQVGPADVTHDVNVPVDQTTCSAAGYGYHYAGLTESFSSYTTPAGWTVDDKIGNGQTWAFTDPGRRGNRTGGSGGSAIVDSSYYGYGKSQDTSLISPVLDFSQRTHPSLIFRTDYNGYSLGQAGDVDLSVDGGQTWTNVWHHAKDSARGPRTEVVDLSQAAGKANVQVRFHFTAKWGYWWQVDDVFLGDRTCDPAPGGLVVGQVADKNTGAGINGATVTSAGKPAEKTTSAATPNDPNLDDGFYWMFSSLTGEHTFTATAANYYRAQDITVNVVPKQATDGMFALAAPRIEVSPGQLSKTVDWQGNGSATMTVKNTGTAPVTAKIGEWPGGYQPAAAQQGAPLQEVKGDFSPLRLPPGKTTQPAAAEPAATPYAAPWTTVADYPIPIMDNAAATIDGKVYSVAGVDGTHMLSKAYVYDPGTQAWSALPNLSVAREAPQAVAYGGKLYVFGGWGSNDAPVAKTEIYDTATGVWSTGDDNPKPSAGAAATVLNGKIYIVGGCTSDSCGKTDVQVYDPASDSWSSGPAYPEPTSWLGCGGIGTKVYCAGGLSGSTSTRHAYGYDPDSGSWAPIADLPTDLWAMGYSVAAGKLLASGGVTYDSTTLTNRGFTYDPGSDTWTPLPNSNRTVYRGGSACGFYKIGGTTGNFYAFNTIELLPGYDQCGTTDVPWLSADKTEVTLQPGESVDVTVSLNANIAEITQPGTFTAQLSISAKTPYRITPVPVTLVVNPPKTWGKITGTVTGVGCTGTSTPLTGATVRITSKKATYTLKTDKNGQYVLWLDVRNNPLTVTASKDGWAPQTTSVEIEPREAITANFSLKPDPTCT
ncbi:carboxypeptidase regulatory-like domain-containing protein [Micromonospora sp. DR5-3]|uniref:carboxypeptidase regulatory-like domain-containing protein n=1 Tax=unclassified Micromonospora TaxID=2617518 RepID=UPI0011D8348E|nr:MULTISPECIES: carboxypeptidase regulatory-like domain-containing protein [unclassified Micromonospora]MCW3820761.1 carboxypeptidase regulatory-like domain-containing protein [Micromonospora sp. DR5-3]TYC14260.1 galactose oxidase [Micromonospora sp. MP36]